MKMGKTILDYDGISASIKVFQTGMPNTTSEVAIINDVLGELDVISLAHDSFLSAEVGNTDVTTKLNDANTSYENYITALQGVIGAFQAVDKKGPEGNPPTTPDGEKPPETTPAPKVNIDTNGDNIPDVNVDITGDNIPDINIDTNGDNIADVNIDIDGDKKPDVNIDTNGDNVADVNIDINGDKKPDLNIDTNGDGIADVNIDTNGDGKPDLNIDTNGDGIADINIDSNKDGKPDQNIDTNGDNEADKNIVNTDGTAHSGVGFAGGEFDETTSEVQSMMDGTEDDSILDGLKDLAGSIAGGKGKGFSIDFKDGKGGAGGAAVAGAAGLAGLGAAATAGVLLAKKRKEKGIVGDEDDDDFDDDFDEDEFDDDNIDEDDLLNGTLDDDSKSGEKNKKKSWLYGLGIGLAGAGLAAGLIAKDEDEEDED